ncbi:hypothetical protein [Fictibacillus sp. JL2B1089]|uniref:hypothetical protein n=1 Tax=Fictibacillus sp. JL2B1089 TaxID=3399565 RepID=UPI003A86E415
MAFDFDPFSHLDINHDQIVDAQDLKMYELTNGNGLGILDLNHDFLADKFQSDLNMDGHSDTFQSDLNNNTIIDQFEFNQMGTLFHYDINHDDKIDDMDKALAITFLSK